MENITEILREMWDAAPQVLKEDDNYEFFVDVLFEDIPLSFEGKKVNPHDAVPSGFMCYAHKDEMLQDNAQ